MRFPADGAIIGGHHTLTGLRGNDPSCLQLRIFISGLYGTCTSSDASVKIHLTVPDNDSEGTANMWNASVWQGSAPGPEGELPAGSSCLWLPMLAVAQCAIRHPQQNLCAHVSTTGLFSTCKPQQPHDSGPETDRVKGQP